MDKIIFDAIKRYGLSQDENYYLDSNGHIRARGFFYDELTGIFINELGDLDYDSAFIQDIENSVRHIIGFIAKSSTQETIQITALEPEFI